MGSTRPLVRQSVLRMDLVLPEVALRCGLFTVGQARAAGVSRSEQRRHLDRGVWRQVERGILATFDREKSEHDALHLALLRAGPRSAASHASAARLHGWDLLQGSRTVHLVVPANQARARAARGVVVHRASRPQVVRHAVLRSTAPACTAIDLAGSLPRAEAVIAVDSALRSTAVTLDSLTQTLRGQRTWERSGEAAAALALASPLSGSVPESAARMLWHGAGLPAPTEQLLLVLPGIGVVRVDFAWVAARLVVEIDGWAFHAGPDAFARDRARDRALVLAGWPVLRFPTALVRDDPEEVVATVAAALAKGSSG